ncbi:MAG TPA: hypothetical protein VHO24_13510 [Opitutaceae bacterium]|nr:hypothetical protein [Opitutaceae bacterium]
MAEPAITIRDLRIRVPGMGRAEARRLGEAVARELAAHPPAVSTPRQLGAINLRVTGSAAGGTQQLASQIAASLRGSLQ